MWPSILVGTTDPTEPGDDSAQNVQEFQTVAVSLEDLRARIATTCDGYRALSRTGVGNELQDNSQATELTGQ